MADRSIEPPISRDPDALLGGQHRLALAICAACSGLAFIILAVFAHRIAFFPIDLTITHSVQSLHAAWFVLPLHVLSAIGFAPLVDIFDATIILLIFVAGRRWEAVASTFAVLGATGLNYLVKAIVMRPRPSNDLIRVEHHLTGSTFPAGHVMDFTAFLGFLCYLTWVWLVPSWRRIALIGLLVAMITLMGIARIYDGEHWPSDVLGAYIAGILWLAVTIELYRWRRRRNRNRAP